MIIKCLPNCYKKYLFLLLMNQTQTHKIALFQAVLRNWSLQDNLNLTHYIIDRIGNVIGLDVSMINLIVFDAVNINVSSQ